TSLVYADLQTGALGAAFSISSTRFLIGPAVGLAYPARGEVTFVRDATGAANGLIWTAEGTPPLQAQRVPVDTTEVTYPGGDGPSRLAGRLVTPRSPGRHPAVVLVHGAGKVTRRNWQTDLLSGLFALHGLATLSYDKRGVGDSEGVYVGGIASAQNISLLGRDALAGVAYLQSRADIDAAQIGLQGSSQAGWIIPYAAAESPDVAFMLLWSGPGVSQGISDLYDNLAETTAPAQLAETLRETPASGFDPLPYLARIRVPGFWAYGDRDLTVPVPESIAKLAALRAAGHPDFTWQVFPTGDHDLWTVDSPTGDDLRLSPGFAPGLFPAMHTWLEAHIDAK
ncbi:MAG TPA: prolyl oligopeptidase family serine peptidase, partial [Chloroflexia bacterium]|nr:prolyl oligopeptidase family serine peptidase [Chloroflexia bacterium]